MEGLGCLGKIIIWEGFPETPCLFDLMKPKPNFSF